MLQKDGFQGRLLAVGSSIVLPLLWLLVLLEFPAFPSNSSKGLGGFLLPKEQVTQLTSLYCNLLTRAFGAGSVVTGNWLIWDHLHKILPSVLCAMKLWSELLLMLSEMACEASVMSPLAADIVAPQSASRAV